MKKKVSFLLIALLVALAALTGCSSGGDGDKDGGDGAGGGEELKVVKVGASPAPHAEILAVAKEILADEGYDLQITEFQDYVLPNTAVDTGDIDANYFQHRQYLQDFNAKNGTKLTEVVGVHYEPFGVYAGKTDSLENLADGARIGVPNDPTNEGRALLLLQDLGLIKLSEDAGLEGTILDITENPKNLDIVELEAATLVRALSDTDVAVINGNYAIEGGLSVADALAVESADSNTGEIYTNVLVVNEGHENDEGIKALAEALCSDKVKAFIEETYGGAVVPVF